MKTWTYLIALVGVSCAHTGTPDFPQTQKVEHTLSKHGDVRQDPYFWLRERENPKVIEHLRRENNYTARMMAPVSKLEDQIFLEMKGRFKEDDASYPYKEGSYYYSHRFEKGQQYPLYVRSKSVGGKEEILLNGPVLAKGHNYFESTAPMMSPSGNIMAYAVDTVGRRRYTIYFKDLRTGKLLPNKITDVRPNVAWANDNETVFFTQQNAITLRAEKVFRYNLKVGKSELVYFEPDETFSVGIARSLSGKFIYMGSGSTLTTEARYLDANTPFGKFKILNPREREHEYSGNDDGKNFYILTNRNAKNHRVMITDINHPEEKYWKELIPHRPDVFIDDITVFKNHLVLEERYQGLNRIAIYDMNGKNPYIIPFNDSAYSVSLGVNHEFNSSTVRFEYESLRLPPSEYDINLITHQQTLLKQRPVPTYNADLYKTERIFIKARDGAEVPVSLLMKKDVTANGKAPMLMYGYGSYGANMEPYFRTTIFSLVDRGFVFALVNIRGGSELGRDWYDNGRTMKKKNTFNDFIDVTESLVQQKYANPRRVYAMGGSAGGLLMGAIINDRPDLYQAVVAEVPFVDVVTTMLDDTIPLTTGEYDEWGNPNEKAAYDYIKSYSPYDNVKEQKYPNLLVTTALQDSQVQYWEPAKWVAKIRDYNTGSSMILLKTNMDGGHGGASGRFDALKEDATEFAFILEVNQKVEN